MKLKKVLALVLIVALLAAVGVALVACDPEDEFKVGFIFLHDESSTYDKNFIDAAREATSALGLSDSQVLFRTNVPESEECYNAARDLVDEGCDIIFADSFGHEQYMLQAAREFPDVQFCHATGTRAHTEGVANYHNAFASIYEGRYLAGIAAGMKLVDMYGDENDALTDEEAKIGYVGAYTYAEVISGYTSFYLGVKSIVPNVTMEVTFTGSWYDETAEREGASLLISRGAKLISQHADSMGAPSACEQQNIPNVSYNGSTEASCPNTFIVSSRINWVPYFNYMITQVQNGEAIAADWTGTLENGAVVLTDVGAAAAAGTQDAINAARAQLIAGTLEVFNTANFTVTKTDTLNVNATVDNGVLTAYMADVNYDEAFAADTQVVANGVFEESAYRSAPYFDVRIDGITLLNQKF